MLRQASIEKYFKVKSQSLTSLNTDNKKNIKTYNLSLLTPTPESINMSDSNKSTEVIEIVNVDEDLCTTPKSACLSTNNSERSISGSSDATVVYSLTPRTPQKTPQKSPTTNSQSGSGDKFFSPTKKRRIAKKSPSKVKRKLVQDLDGDPQVSRRDQLFIEASGGACLKTILFLAMINKYLKDESLKNLLDENSHVLVSSLLRVVNPGVTLICRLYWLMDRFYNVEHLKNIAFKGKGTLDNLGTQEMINSLVCKGFIIKGELQDDNKMSFKELTTILKVNDLKEICKHFKLKVKTKGGAIETLNNFSGNHPSLKKYFTGCESDNSNRVLKAMYEKAGPCYKLSKLARSVIYKLYFLMHMGINYSIIRDKKIEFLLINEKVKAETFPVNNEMAIDNATVVFKNRDEFERYLNAHNIYENFLKKTDLDEKCTIIKQVYSLYNAIREDELTCYKALVPWLRRYTPAYIYIKILETGIQELKKDKSGQYHTLALEILTTLISQTAFRQHKKANWYAEKALILHKLFNQHDEAAELLLEGLKSNLSEEAKDNIRPRACKIAMKKNITLKTHLKKELLAYATKESILEKNISTEHINKLPMEKPWRGKIQFETRSVNGRLVQEAEEYCVTHYINSGQFTHGYHWEGRIIITIFFLLFWDIIYTKPRDICGVFLCRFQVFPLDMFTDCFYTNRKELIDERLSIIERSTQEEVLKCMEEQWYNRPKHETSGIAHNIGWANVNMVASCLGPRSLAAICRRLVTNYHYTHSGFPDLTLWNVDTKKIKFVEVKTDSDKPSMKQIQWMNYLRENGIDTELCYIGANTTRCKSRASKRIDELMDSDD